MDIHRSHARESLLNKKIILALLVSLVVFALFIAYRQLGVGTGINRTSYQLVSLSNGESYIGKLSGTSGTFVTLRDVYFQQTSETQKSESQSAAVESMGQITVAKLSTTVAKPEDTMRIARDKIVHWENLQEDSKIVQAIRQGGAVK